MTLKAAQERSVFNIPAYAMSTITSPIGQGYTKNICFFLHGLLHEPQSRPRFFINTCVRKDKLLFVYQLNWSSSSQESIKICFFSFCFGKIVVLIKRVAQNLWGISCWQLKFSTGEPDEERIRYYVGVSDPADKYRNPFEARQPRFAAVCVLLLS